MLPRVERQLITGALQRLDTLYIEITERRDSLLLSRAWERGSEGVTSQTTFKPASYSNPPANGDVEAVVRRVWWQKPDCLRDEVIFGGGLLAVNVCRGAAAYSYSPQLGVLYTNDPSVQGPRPRWWKRVPIPTLPTVQTGLEQISLLQPPFRHPGWELTVLGEQRFAGRSTLSIAAHRLQPRTSGPDWHWDGIDHFSAVIDEQLGLPFRLAALVDGREAAVFSARAFRIDEPIAADVFRLEPPRGVFVAQAHPHPDA
jgi:hypothetical protein